MKVFFDAILRQTRKACEFKFGDRRVWIPESQILKEDLGLQWIDLPEWLVRAKELEEFRLRPPGVLSNHKAIGSTSSVRPHSNMPA